MKDAQLAELLDDLERRDVIAADVRQQLAASSSTPWYLSVLSGLAAWLAALILIGTWMVINGSTAAGLAKTGLLLALSVWLFYRPGQFAAQLGLALSMIAQGMLILNIDRLGLLPGSPAVVPALAVVLTSAVMLIPRSPSLHRLFCATLMVGGVGVLIGPGVWLSLYGLLLVTGAAVLWLARVSWASHPQANTIRAVTGAVTLGALILAAWGRQGIARSIFSGLAGPDGTLVVWLYPTIACLVFIGSTLWLTRSLAQRPRVGCIGAALLMVALTWQAPGLLISAALWLATFHARDRFWCVMTGLFATLYLGDLYYSLHISLLAKSLVLLATGAVLLLLRWPLRVWRERLT